MIRDRDFLDTVTVQDDKKAYVDEWTIIAPNKLQRLKKQIKDKFKEVFDFVSLFAFSVLKMATLFLARIT